MYKVARHQIEGLPTHQKTISELKYVHPSIENYLKSLHYEVHHEKEAFKLPYTGYTIAHRVDFLAFKGNEILIAECKGYPFQKARIFGAVLQLTEYMRMYRMLQNIPNPQYLLLKEFDPLLIREGELRGVLAVPYLFPHNEKKRVFKNTYDSLQGVDLLEPTIELWDLR
ncbi:MAG: hypothetical protein ACYDBJ_27100 [Aggregatilineales bacterium]